MSLYFNTIQFPFNERIGDFWIFTHNHHCSDIVRQRMLVHVVSWFWL